jgi:FKBP-type peptidyl-prolyl cis-trans isomerase SlpA
VSGRTVAPGDTLQLRYALRPRGGDDLVSNFDDPEPATVTLGDGTLAPMLEQWLIDLPTGERHVFLLDPWQAFGVSQPELVQTLPKTDLPSDLEFAVDQLVEFAMPNGQTLAGHILEIGEDAVKVDFNHPLADLSIEFEVEVERILPSGEASGDSAKPASGQVDGYPQPSPASGRGSEGDAQTDGFAPSPQPSPASGGGSEGDAQTD